MIDPAIFPQRKATLTSWFGFEENPFGVTPDPRFFCSAPQHAEALSTLAYSIQEKKGLILVSGEVGTGKTVLLRKLMRQLDVNVESVFVSISRATGASLLELLIYELGL